MTNFHENSFHFGYEVLGPIFHDFCCKVYLYHAAYSPDAISLFAYRGGRRLLYLYREYLKVNSLSSPINIHGFLISRILALKGTIRFSYKEAKKLLLREFPNTSLSDFLACFCTNTKIDLPQSLKERKIDQLLIKEAILGDSSWARQVQKYLKIQEVLLHKYVTSLVSGNNKVLFVDTGWNGTTQLFLMKGFPEIDWYGIYFGKWETWHINPPHFHTISGLGVEGNFYTPKKPETAILYYHHIIEAPLEPNIPSVEHLAKDAIGKIQSSRSIDPKKIPPQKDEAIFSGICSFLRKNKGLSISEQYERAYKARKILQKKILSPSRNDIKAMMVKQRSADFGKKKFVPIFYPTRHSVKPTIKEQYVAVRRSIWKQGKITEEFPVCYPIIHKIYNSRILSKVFIKLIDFCKKKFISFI